MTYVISNIHGDYDRFKAMLEKISFSDRDVMYILGDTVDYGEKSMELIGDISVRYNILPILGEHDLKAAKLLTALEFGTADKVVAKLLEMLNAFDK